MFEVKVWIDVYLLIYLKSHGEENSNHKNAINKTEGKDTKPCTLIESHHRKLLIDGLLCK